MNDSNSKETLSPYWYSLGKFVHRYAAIEATMHQVLRITARTSEDSAKVMFSGTRVRGAVDLIKRFHVARNEQLPPTLEKAFSKIGELTKARDRLLHYGFEVEDGTAIVTDESRNLGKRAFKLPVSVSDLDKLEADAITINGCLVTFWIEARRPDMIGGDVHQNNLNAARAPWQYKPPAPMRPEAKSRGSAPERKSQLPPSQV